MLFSVPEQRQTQIAILPVFASSALASAPAQRTSSGSAGLFRASETPHRSVPAYSCVNSCLISCWDWFQSANSGSGFNLPHVNFEPFPKKPNIGSEAEMH